MRHNGLNSKTVNVLIRLLIANLLASNCMKHYHRLKEVWFKKNIWTIWIYFKASFTRNCTSNFCRLYDAAWYGSNVRSIGVFTPCKKKSYLRFYRRYLLKWQCKAPNFNVDVKMYSSCNMEALIHLTLSVPVMTNEIINKLIVF